MKLRQGIVVSLNGVQFRLLGDVEVESVPQKEERIVYIHEDEIHISVPTYECGPVIENVLPHVNVIVEGPCGVCDAPIAVPERQLSSPLAVPDGIEKAVILQVQRGDVVVLTTPHSMSPVGVDRIREQFQRFLPDGVKCCVLDDGLDVKVIRPEATEAKIEPKGYR